MDVKDRINALDDFQVVRFYQYFARQLFEATEVSVDQIRAGIPDDIRRLPQFSSLENLSPDEAGSPSLLVISTP